MSTTSNTTEARTREGRASRPFRMNEPRASRLVFLGVAILAIGAACSPDADSNEESSLALTDGIGLAQSDVSGASTAQTLSLKLANTVTSGNLLVACVKSGSLLP